MSERATFKVKIFFNSSGGGHIGGDWRTGLTDADVFSLRSRVDGMHPLEASVTSTGFLATSEHPFGTAFRYAVEYEYANGSRSNTVAWVVREF